MNRVLIKQLMQYGTVGVFALGVDVGTFLGLRAVGVDLVPANVCARFAGAVAAYSGNYLWTFAKPAKLTDWLNSSWRYALLWVGATLLSTFLLSTPIRFGANETVSKLGVEMLMPVLNFLMARRWVFK